MQQGVHGLMHKAVVQAILRAQGQCKGQHMNPEGQCDASHCPSWQWSGGAGPTHHWGKQPCWAPIHKPPP